MKKLESMGLLTVLSLASLLFTTACKPTERNYNDAYQAALAAKQNVNDDVLIPGTGSSEFDPDFPMFRLPEGDSIRLRKHALMPLEGDTAALKPYNVTIAIYGMSTNARSHAEQLARQGYKSRVFVDGDKKYHTIAGAFDSWENLAPFIKDYVRRHPKDVYVGLPAIPVVEVPVSLRVELP